MEPMEWVQVLSYVRPEGNKRRTWPTAMVVLTRLAGWRGGGILTGPDVATMAGVTNAAGRRLMLQLERMKIVKRDPDAKLKWVALNEDWRRWDVEWAIPPAAIEAQLALGREERAQNVIQRFSARSKSGRSWDRIARYEGARTCIEEALEEVEIARSKSGRGGNVDRAPMSARIERRARTVLERAHSHGDPQQGSAVALADADHPTPAAAGGSDQQQRMDALGGGWVKAKIVQRCIPGHGRRVAFLNGEKHLGILNHLLERHGVAAVGALVEHDYVPDHELPANLYVEQLRDLIGELTANGMSLDQHLTAMGQLGPPPDPNLAAELTAGFVQAGAHVDELKGAAGTHLLDKLAKWQDERRSGEDPEAIAQ